MESVASKLRSAKHLHNTNKDAPKRLGESLPGGGGKKRILGDITNRALATKGKLDTKKDLKVKAEKSTSLDSENVNISTTSLRSQSSKSSSSGESTMFVTAIEINDR
ncbi:hypothetical protein AVEN_129289-1 [Araneus ventricosus]|uniref:Uncharacterized protein n=1 Tax=Araneus ventricosus TaxID=182803 RepID=A0A4Y2TW20_ARAVE|nr:hypothetical protein AVEN_129289-1 [Araneus ventricosus]